MCVSCVFVSGRFFCLLHQVLVIICQILHGRLQMACFLWRNPCLEAYLWAPSCLSIVVGGGRCTQILLRENRGRGVFKWMSLRRSEKTILAREIYCSDPNAKPNPHSGPRVRKGLGTRAPWRIQEYCPWLQLISIF